MRKLLFVFLIILLPIAIAAVTFLLLKPRPEPTRPDATGYVTTLAGTGSPGLEDGDMASATFSDPFGIVVDSRGTIYITDAGEGNRIRRITLEGKVETVAGSEEGFNDGRASEARFNSPSGLAIDKKGNLIIADTANHSIRKIDSQGRVITIAGTGSPGFRDGPAGEAQFDAPVGVAVDQEGNILIADTYNDRIRKLSADGTVSTLAGAGSPGHRDGPAGAALFDTPCGLVAGEQGAVFIADTGNDCIRRIDAQGEVSTLGQDPAAPGDRPSFDNPMALALTHDGFLFVTDAGGGRIRRIAPDYRTDTFAGVATGFADGLGEQARFNHPSGIAVDRRGNVYIADSRNYLIRRITVDPPAAADSTTAVESGPVIQPVAGKGVHDRPVIPEIAGLVPRDGRPFPWPLAPQDAWHEVTGVVGEARGAPGSVALHHLHSGLDVRGNMGDPVLSVLDEKVGSPVSAWGFGGSNEGLQVGLMSYIHLRVGRDAQDRLQGAERFKPRYDEAGKLAGVRVRRGTRFKVGDTIGTLNRLYHVHLNFGPWNAQANPIDFPFPRFKDTVAPVVEAGGIEVLTLGGEALKERRNGRLVIRGDVRIVVTAYDRVDGNVASRKLGLYRLGYQLIRAGGVAQWLSEPVMNIEFNRLPPDDRSVFVVYAEGSGVSAYGSPTRFRYIATNVVKDGIAREGFLRTAELEPGDYTLRVVAEDRAGNRATGSGTQIPVTVTR